jgi:uncharacterized protein YcfJ
MNTSRFVAIIMLLTLTITGCTVIGVGVGATVGAVVGSLVGTGSSASMVGGALIGGLIGSDAAEAPDAGVATETKQSQ